MTEMIELMERSLAAEDSWEDKIRVFVREHLAQVEHQELEVHQEQLVA